MDRRIFLLHHLFLDLTPLTFQLRRYYLLCPLQFQFFLLPPPPRHSRPRPLSRLFTKVQNWLRRNILRGRILSPRDVGTNLLKARFRHCRHQRRILQTPTPLPPHLPPNEPLRDPELKASQAPLHPGGQDPRLLPKQKHRLDYSLEEVPQHLRVRPLPDQNPQHPLPNLLRLL